MTLSDQMRKRIRELKRDLTISPGEIHVIIEKEFPQFRLEYRRDQIFKHGRRKIRKHGSI